MDVKKELMQIYTTAKSVMLSPKAFFKDVSKEKGYKFPIIYLSLLLLLNAALGIGLVVILASDVVNVTVQSFVVALLATLIYGLILNLFMSAVIFVWLKVLKLKGTYNKAFLLTTYSRTPGLVLGWIPIPFISTVGWFYNIYLLIVGTSVMYKVSMKKSALIYIVPIAVLMVVSILISSALGSQLPTQ